MALPPIDSVSQKLKQCLLLFEDEYFYYHPGVNPISTFRAIKQNLSYGRIKSGGSTISMQVIRLARNNPQRSYFEKLKEMYLAIRLEFSYSKNEILNFTPPMHPMVGILLVLRLRHGVILIGHHINYRYGARQQC